MELLVEKYRPSDFSDVYGNQEALETINLIIENLEMPHLLFTGPPGTGKTTCAKILAKKLLDSDMDESLLELNASDDRGIDVVRNKIKNFSQKKTKNNFKIIILDEADSMTVPAQQAMRRVMEVHSEQCRFILICNSFSKIYEPIQSRCAVLRFEKLEEDAIKEKLRCITESEEIKITEKGLEVIVELSDGDMRQALNILESCKGYPDTIKDSTILKITGQPSPKLVKNIITLLLAKECETALEKFDSMWEEKYDPTDIISSFFRVAKSMDSYDLLKFIGVTHLRIIEGVNSKLQFYSLFHEIANMK